MTSLTQAPPALSWPRLLFYAARAALLEIAFVYFAVALVALGLRAASRGSAWYRGPLEALGPAIGGSLGPITFLALVGFGGYRLALRSDHRWFDHGLVLGCLAPAILLLAHPVLVLPLQRSDFVLYPFIGVVGGLGGAYWGARAHAKARETEQALRRTVDALKDAGDLDGVAAAVGEHFGRETGIEWVTVWTPREDGGSEDGPPHGREEALKTFEVTGRWARPSASHRLPPPGSRLDGGVLPAAALSADPTPVFGPRQAELLRGSPDPWGTKDPHPVLGYRLVIVGEIVGLLVFSRGPAGAPGEDAGRPYAVIASTAAMALDRVRLWTEATEATRLEEHRRMSGELHDTLIQGFIAIRTFLAGMSSPKDAEDLRLWELARATARDNLTEARRLAWAYRNYENPGFSLGPELDGLARRWSKENRVPARTRVTGVPVALSGEAHHALKRAAQEALANAAKHAQATEVRVTLSFEEDLVLLDVCDDGVGFDPEPGLLLGTAPSLPEEGGQGLASMRARLERLGGILSVESERGGGTAVTAEMPVANGAAPNGDGDAGADGRHDNGGENHANDGAGPHR